MTSYSIGYDKGYKCPCCNKFYGDITLLSKFFWKCPDCEEYIHIAAPELQSGHTLIRILATELKEGDSVCLPGCQGVYSVIAIERKGTDAVFVALKNYRRVKYKSSDFVSVITGGYYEDQWKDNPFASC